MFEDKIKPVIKIKGNVEINLAIGGTYKEPWYEATDNYDGDITDTSLVTVKAIIGDTLGTYYVYYNAKDSHDNPSEEVVRTVIVLDLISPIIYFTDKCPQYITIEALDENDKYDPLCDVPGEGYIVYDDYTPDIEIIQTHIFINLHEYISALFFKIIINISCKN